MALQVWLPLREDVHNQGLYPLEFTNSNATVATGGCLGSCYTFTATTGTGISAAIASNDFLTRFVDNHSFSLCAWFKTTDTSFTPVINITYGIYLQGGPNARFILYNSSRTINCPGTKVTNDGKWHHACGTYDAVSGAMKIYVDGVLDNTVQYTAGYQYVHSWTNPFFVGRNPNNSTANSSYFYQGSINDVRFYDHCLSAKEVKEISKGLVQHLKLDDMRIGTVTNMLTAGGTYGTTTGSTWTGHYYVGTVENAVGPVPFARMNKLEITVSGTTTGGGASLARQSNIVVQPNTQYTYSTYVKASDNLQYGHANFLYRYEYDSANTKTIEQGVYTTAKREDIGDGWYRIWNTFTTQATTAKMHVYFYTYPGKTMTYYLGGCQLEKGSILHPYTEGTQTNSSVIDCSGYLNNGTIYGSPSLYASAPKYECSTYIGTNNAIVAGRGGMVRPSITVAIWAYMDSWSSYNARLASCTEGGGWNFEPSSSKMNFAMGTGASSNTYKSATSSRTLASLGSGWHHFVGTYDGFTTKIYIDGVLEGSNAAYTTHTPIFYVNNAVFLGAEAAASQTVPTGSYFPGALSDFRIYGTALSAEDVAELYHTAASVDNHGNFFCAELKEV